MNIHIYIMVKQKINEIIIIILLFLILYTHFYIFINYNNKKNNNIDDCKYNMLEYDVDNDEKYKFIENEKRWELQYFSILRI